MHTTLFIRNLSIRGTHGQTHLRKEKFFCVDIELTLGDISVALAHDSLRDTTDYRDAVAIARRIISGPSVHLIETLAHILTTEILALPHVQKIKLTLTKRELQETFDSGITIFKTKPAAFEKTADQS